MSEPAADGTGRMLRSVASAMDDGKLDPLHLPRIAGLIRETADERDRLLALVAAQAEQIAEAEARCDEMSAAVAWSDLSDERVAHIAEAMRESRFEDLWQDAEQRADKAEAELSALHATDDYQRWARVVVERDAAREAVGRVRALCREAEIATAASRGDGPYRARVLVADVLAALDGGAAT